MAFSPLLGHFLRSSPLVRPQQGSRVIINFHLRPQSTFSFVLFVGDKPWYFLFIDKKNRKAYRGFEARLDPVTAGVVPWAIDEEPIDAMEVDTLLEHVEEVAPAASTTTTEAVTATAEELL